MGRWVYGHSLFKVKVKGHPMAFERITVIYVSDADEYQRYRQHRYIPAPHY
jgi:hypothetical protein